MGLSLKKIHDPLTLCRSDWHYNEFCCYNKCHYKEGSLYILKYLKSKPFQNIIRVQEKTSLSVFQFISYIESTVQVFRAINNCKVKTDNFTIVSVCKCYALFLQGVNSHIQVNILSKTYVLRNLTHNALFHMFTDISLIL